MHWHLSISINTTKVYLSCTKKKLLRHLLHLFVRLRTLILSQAMLNELRIVLKDFNYLKENMSYNGILFLQETHSSRKDEIKWKDEFKKELFFSHRKTNSCGVLIGIIEKRSFKLLKKKNDENGRLLILEAMIDDGVFILINLYNPNIEIEQVFTWEKLNLRLQTFDDLKNKIIILAGDFNLYLDSELEAEVGSLVLKKSSVLELIEFKEKYNLCDIWRIWNTKENLFTFLQKHCSGFQQRRLDYSFVSNTLQE